ncbi:MAG TPA: tetratricopeptide repeat protein [Verrucomicrobiae bacterium]|jgi:hypothetical protein
MNIPVTLAGLGGFCFVLWDFGRRLPGRQYLPLRRWFIAWMGKGVLAPFAVWMLFNGGFWSALTPLVMPGVSLEWAATVGLFVSATYWTAFTVGWLLAIIWEQEADRRQMRRCVLVWSAILAPVAILMTWSFGWRMAGFAGTIWLLPILQQVLLLLPEENLRPIYSRAIAAMQFDKYEEAEQAVIEELESCEDDFEGWMMLAGLYADQFRDLPAARKVIRDTCEHPGTSPSQFAVACHRLADWELKLAQDPDAARAALESICRRHPKSHLDHMARLRINQLPATPEEWQAQQDVKKIHLGRLAAPGAQAGPEMSRQEAFDRSQQCVEILNSQPDDIATREELARLWAENLEQVEMGVEQLQLLLSMPGVKQAKAGEWLGLMAAWHLKFPQNMEAARAVMERLVRQYPQSPQALAAQRRLNVMNIEAKMRHAAEARHEGRF